MDDKTHDTRVHILKIHSNIIQLTPDTRYEDRTLNCKCCLNIVDSCTRQHTAIRESTSQGPQSAWGGVRWIGEFTLASAILLSSVNPPQQYKITASMRDGEALASMFWMRSKLAWKNSHVKSCPSFPEDETLHGHGRDANKGRVTVRGMFYISPASKARNHMAHCACRCYIQDPVHGRKTRLWIPIFV